MVYRQMMDDEPHPTPARFDQRAKSSRKKPQIRAAHLGHPPKCATPIKPPSQSGEWARDYSAALAAVSRDDAGFATVRSERTVTSRGV